MRYRLFCKNNYGLSGVIEALLLVGLVAIILSTIQLVYIPEIMKQKENDHLDTVENQFSNLKSVIETQFLMGIAQSDKSVAYSPMSSPVDLGTKKLPYFVTSNTIGKLEIFDKEESTSYIEIEIDAVNSSIIPLTSIKYELFTMYIAYKPKFVFEGGGIIYNQTGGKNQTGEVMKVDPSIYVENNSLNVTINYYIPVFNCPEGKDNIQGIDLAYIRTNYTNSNNIMSYSVNNIKIYSDYLDAWYNCLFEHGEGILWRYRNYIDVTQESDYIKISPNGKSIDVKFSRIEMGIQTGQGIVV